MTTLRSAMYAGYNKFGEAKVRIGSWKEELALKELTGVTRLAHPKNKGVLNDTAKRVLYHDEKIKGAGAGKSTCETSHVPPRSVQETKDLEVNTRPGPKAVNDYIHLMAIVGAEEAQRLAHEVDEIKEDIYFTTSRQSFRWYSARESQEAAPNRVCRNSIARSTSSLEDIMEVTPSELRPATYDPRVTTGNEIAHAQDHSGWSEPTVTLWNTGGFAHRCANTNGSFARTNEFTEPLTDCWTTCRPSLGLGPNTFPDIGDRFVVSLASLRSRIVERAAGRALPSVRGLWQLMRSKTCDFPHKIATSEFREGMACFGVPLTDFELHAVVEAFGIHKSGQIHVEKFIHFVRDAGLSKSRHEWIRDGFKRLQHRAEGRVRLSHIRDTCNFSSLLVVEGKTSTEELAAEFLRHFDYSVDALKCNKRIGDGDTCVSEKDFTEAFHDIGAALPCNGNTSTRPSGVHAPNGDSGDTMFHTILQASIGMQ